jgi:diguanylate cyclase (GGDEF)-like protein
MPMHKPFLHKPTSIHLRHEITQCRMRYAVAAVAFVALLIHQTVHPTVGNYTAISFLGGYLLLVTAYLILIKRQPRKFTSERVLIMMLADLLCTAYAIYLSDHLSALFVGFYLWNIIGSGMRFGVQYALISMVVTILSWFLVLFFSPYWREHLFHFFGWLVTFIVVPAYYFALVNRLHVSLKELNSALHQTEILATRDSLTGIANRYHINRLAEELLIGGQPLAIFLLDLDGFKGINDQFGHDAGDKLLIEVARTLTDCCKPDGIVGRLGGDEFIVVVKSADRAQMTLLADRILSTIAATVSEYGQVTASIGICFCPEDADTLSLAKSYADSAMYTAKRLGKNRYHYYSYSV